MSKQKPIIIAHRGASFYAPENTKPSFLLAKAMNIDYIETDIRRTKDHQLILLHDPDLQRTSNITEIFPHRQQDPVGSFTLEELRQLDFGSWFNQTHPEWARKSYVNTPILTFSEFLKFMEDTSSGLYIETKDFHLYPNIEQEIVNELEKWPNKKSSLVFQSFELKSVQNFKQYRPDVPGMLLVNHIRARKEGLANIVQEAKEHVTGIGIAGYIGWPWNFRFMHKLGLKTHCYTINRRWQLRLLYLFGARQIVSDRGDLAMWHFGHAPKCNVDKLLQDLGY